MNRVELIEILDLSQEVLESSGLSCLDVRWISKEGTLRIYIDSPGGVRHEQCAQATRSLRESSLLGEPFFSRFNVEVSSPGVDRPLRRIEHFSNARGENISLRLTEPYEGRKALKGKLVNAIEDGSIEVLSRFGEHVIPLEHVYSANIEFDWGS